MLNISDISFGSHNSNVIFPVAINTKLTARYIQNGTFDTQDMSFNIPRLFTNAIKYTNGGTIAPILNISLNNSALLNDFLQNVGNKIPAKINIYDATAYTTKETDSIVFTPSCFFLVNLKYIIPYFFIFATSEYFLYKKKMHHSTSFSKRKEGCHAATLQSYSIIVPKASLPNRYYITLKIDCQYKIITKTKKDGLL